MEKFVNFVAVGNKSADANESPSPINYRQLIERLNELYRRSQTVPLTPEELVERDRLRREYLKMIRNQVKASLDRIEIVDE